MADNQRWATIAIWTAIVLATGLAPWSPGTSPTHGPAIAEAAQPWRDERWAYPFHMHADFSLGANPEFVDELAALEGDLGRMLDLPTPRETIHLFLFERKTTYDAYMKVYFPRVPARRALYIRERGPGMVFAFRSEELATDVKHEATHAILHSHCSDVPLWLDEGLAEYYELPPSQRADANPYLATTRWQARLGYGPKLEELEALTDPARMGATEYRQAWAWIHFLFHGPREARQALVDYLSELRSGVPSSQPLPQLSQRLRRRVPDLDQQFLQHFRVWKS